MDRDFLARSYRTTLVVTVLGTLFAMPYTGVRLALGLGAGALLGVLNLRLVEELVVNWLRPQGARVVHVLVAAVLKLALVYGVGWALLAWRVLDPAPMGMGMPAVLAVIFLKALGRMYLARAGLGPSGRTATEGQGKERR